MDKLIEFKHDDLNYAIQFNLDHDMLFIDARDTEKQFVKAFARLDRQDVDDLIVS